MKNNYSFIQIKNKRGVNCLNVVGGFMKNIEKYYDNTKNLKPNKYITEFLNNNIIPGKAIELGCGSGRDTINLIKNGWQVLAIDREDVSSYIIEKLNVEQRKSFRFLKQNFEEVELEKCNLLVANYSLPFCNNNKFSELWGKIVDNILPERIFYWQLFWNK